MDKDAIQARAVEMLLRDKRLICQWSTGVGKSLVAIRFIKENRHPGLKTLILVPETNNISNWEDEFKKFNVSLDGVAIACYASLHKYKNSEWDLLVLDEVPHINTQLKTDILSTIKAEYVLALGAVISDDEYEALINLFGTFRFSHIRLEDAIRHNLIPSPRVNIVHMSLDNTIRHLWYDGSLRTNYGVYKAIDDKLEAAKFKFNENQNEMYRIKMNRIGLERKRFLGRCKDEAIQKICRALDEKKKRYICFCSSISQAKALGGKRAFTSATPTSMKLLERFNAEEINALFVVGKLIEGQNLKDIDCGVLGQLGNSNRITIQEIGRILRSEHPIVFVPIIDNTKDNSFLTTVTDNIPKEYIKHYKF